MERDASENAPRHPLFGQPIFGFRAATWVPGFVFVFVFSLSG